MRCFECENEATVIEIDKKVLRLLKMPHPGMVIDCDDPHSLRGYCELHWIDKFKKKEINDDRAA